MHFVVNKACGSAHRLSSSMSLAFRKEESLLTGAPTAGQGADIRVPAAEAVEKTAMTYKPSHGVRVVDRRLPRAARSKRRRRSQFEDATNLMTQWIEQNAIPSSSATKRRRIVFTDDGSAFEVSGSVVSDDERSDPEDSTAQSGNEGEGSGATSATATTEETASRNQSPEHRKFGQESDLETEAERASRDDNSHPEQDDGSKPNDNTGSKGADAGNTDALEASDADTTTRVVTPTPTEGSDAETSEDEEDSTASSKWQIKLDDVLVSVAKMFISKPRKNRFPPNSRFADAVEELEEEEDDDEEDEEKAMENGINGKAEKQTWKYPEEHTPLSELFGAKKQNLEGEDDASNANADPAMTSDKDTKDFKDGQKLQHAEAYQQYENKRQSENANESHYTNEQARELRVPPVQKQHATEVIDLVSDSSDEESVSNSVPFRVERSQTTRKNIQTFPTDIQTNTLEGTKKTSTLVQRPRRVSQSPLPDRRHERDLPSVASSDTPEKSEEDSNDEDTLYKYNGSSPIGACERIVKNKSLGTRKTSNKSSKLRPYKFNDFQRMWRSVENDIIGYDVETIEKDRVFRKANNDVRKTDTDGQKKAQYGRILPGAMEKIFRDVLQVKKDHIFADFGHGVGNACLQAAYTIGCESKGIELVDVRYLVSEALNKGLAETAWRDRQSSPSMKKYAAGPVELKHGRIEDPAHRDWLTDVDAVFVNNFNDVMSHRCEPSRKAMRSVDEYIAALFAHMKVGSVMVTLNPINYYLGQTQEQAQQDRRKWGYIANRNASFFTNEEIEIGFAHDVVSWSERSSAGRHSKTISVYKYTRVEQEADAGYRPVFLCCDPGKKCRFALNDEPIPATIFDKDNRLVMMNTCPCCGFTKKSLRKKRTVNRNSR